MSPSPGGHLERFFALVQAGDRDGVAAALTADPELVDAFDPNPWCCRGTPLGVAVGRADREMIDLLLARGADIDRKSDWWAGGFAPIHSVPVAHRPALADDLVARGARIDVHAAAMHGWRVDLEALLDADAHRVNEPGGDGARPLHVAADTETAELLLARGAWIEARDVDHGGTPAQWAVRERPAVARFLLDEGAEGDVFLYAALEDLDRLRRHVEAEPAQARAVLTRDAYPSPGSKAGHIYVYALAGYGSTVLHACAAVGAAASARLLLEAGADPRARGGYDDASPLHVAAWNGRLEVIDALVDAGAELEMPSGPAHESTPAGWAIVAGQVGAVERLLARGAAVQPWYARSARSGLAGELRAYSSGTEADFRAILALIGADGGG